MYTTAEKRSKFMAENEASQLNQGQEQNQKQDPQPKTYTQEELDKLIKEAETKGFVSGKTETTKKWEQKVAERERVAREEAEKKAKFDKMSELEKAQTESKEAKEQLQQLKDQIALNEQKEETRKLMKDKGLSEVFLDSVLIPKDADATLAKIDEVKALFDAEVQKAVEAKITTHTPKQSTTVKGNDISPAEYAAIGLPPR